jgi:hypothetical protein
MFSCIAFLRRRVAHQDRKSARCNPELLLPGIEMDNAALINAVLIVIEICPPGGISDVIMHPTFSQGFSH